MRKQVFFNEDPNHFVFERIRAGKTDVTRDDIISFIRQYKNTGVTDFLICLNGSSCWYPSRRTDNVIDKFNRLGDKGDKITWGAAMMAQIYGNGLSIHKMWIDELRACGIRPWLSIRMNDIHGSAHPEDFLNSEMVDNHPEYRRTPHRKAVGYTDFALDYMREGVREYYMTVIEEALETFDADGIEFDFMREIYSLCIGREYEGTEVINDFLRRAHAKVKEAEVKRGHEIKIHVRVPSNPELAMRLGFDVFAWVEEGIVDYLTVCPRWSSSDNNMPIDIWKKIFGGKVQVLAGIESLLDASTAALVCTATTPLKRTSEVRARISAWVRTECIFSTIWTAFLRTKTTPNVPSSTAAWKRFCAWQEITKRFKTHTAATSSRSAT